MIKKCVSPFEEKKKNKQTLLPKKIALVSNNYNAIIETYKSFLLRNVSSLDLLERSLID